MSIDDERIQSAAQFLLRAHREAAPFGPIPEPITPRTINEAYAVQEALQELLSSTRGNIVGYKVAVTTRPMQQMLGLSEPLSGAILAETVHHSPAVLRCSDYIRLGVECEIAVRIGEDIMPAGAPYRRDAIDRYVDVVMPAFEVIDDRQADHSKFSTLLLSFIADNIWNAGIVLGSAMKDWRQLDLAAMHGTLHVNGALAGEGHGKDVMGHPLEALTWLANHFAGRGKTIQKGAIVMTGSIIAAKFLSPGDEARFHTDRFGEICAHTE